jgi:hypothetical protein
MTFKLTTKDARERLESMRDQLETLELFFEDAEYREPANLVYAARLSVSSAIAALPNGCEAPK